MMSSDNNYIRYKVQLLKTHAEKLLKNHVNETDEEYDRMSRRERQIVEDR